MNTAILSRDNPDLLALEESYSKLNLFEQSMWRTWADQIDITKFRGEGAYLSQMMGMTAQRYQNTFDYLVPIGEGTLLARLGEDDAFGCKTFMRNGIVFSRDLLDSVCEIRFLQEVFGDFSGWSILDIGAGYGRFAYRLTSFCPSSYVWCLDAVPLSTFLCGFYLKYRKANRAMSVHFDLVAHDFGTGIPEFDLAVNQYSFSEMPLSAVRHWLNMCSELNIPYLFLVPHAADLVHPTFLTIEPDGSHLDYFHLFEQYGYRVEHSRPKFPIEMTPNLIYSTTYFLFRRG